MRFIKCPRCELNYIPEDEEYCPVCKREMKGERHEDPVELCSICNENPVMPGRDVCVECYKELTQQQGRPSNSETGEEQEMEINIGAVTEIDDLGLGTMQDNSVPPELGEQLSLEEEQSKELSLDVDDVEDDYEDN